MDRNRYSRLGYSLFSEMVKSDVAIERNVKTDSFTDLANECFDLPFEGTCKFYPFNLPELPQYKILAVTGRSGSGKSTILRSVRKSKMSKPMDSDRFVVAEFLEKGVPEEEFCYRMNKMGLDEYEIASKKFGQLSEGEKFRVEVALNIESNVIFDEFTSMVDRTIAKKVSEGIREIADRERLENITLCSCHKDFIEWVRPDLIIDLDDCAMYCKTEGVEETRTRTEDELLGVVEIGI